MEFRLEKDFISINIANPCYEILIEEQTFQTCLPALKELFEEGKIYLKRFGTQVCKFIRTGYISISDAGDETEFANIPEAQLIVFTPEGEDKMSMII